MSNSEDLRLYIASLKENTNTETAMIYTKSEIREAKKRIAHELKQINKYLPVQESNWLPWHMVLSSLKALEWVLKPLKTHIIDNDDYALAVEINKMITPVWYDYCKNAKDDVSLQHQLAYEVQDIIKDLRDWIGEYEAEHPELGRPIAPAITVPEENDVIRKPHYIVNKEVLNVLPVIYAFLVKESVINGDIFYFFRRHCQNVLRHNHDICQFACFQCPQITFSVHRISRAVRVSDQAFSDSKLLRWIPAAFRQPVVMQPRHCSADLGERIHSHDRTVCSV